MLLSVLGWCGLTAVGLALVFQLDASTPLVASVLLVTKQCFDGPFLFGLRGAPKDTRTIQK